MNRIIRTTRLKTCILLPILLMASGIASRCAVANDRPAAMFVGDLFESEVLADNVFGLRQAANRLPAEARYELLKSHVLPGKFHDDFRLFGILSPTDPVVPMIDDHPFDSERQRTGADRRATRIHTGGNLVSPAFDLIAAGKELGKLDDIRFAVQSASAKGEVQHRCQLSMLAMIGIAQQDLGSAETAVNQLYERFVKQRFPNLQDRMPETLFVWVAVENGVLLDDALRFLISIQDAQIRTGQNSGPLEWDRLISNLIGRIEYQKRPASDHVQLFGSPSGLKTWHWTTRIQSWGNGKGIPSGHIQLSNGAIETLANMDDEFLFFSSPLRGNYTLECDCTGFGWKEFFPFVNGTWIGPTHAHDGVTVGELYRFVRTEPVNPKLSRVDDWIHFRVDVRDGFCTRYINSHKVCEEKLSAEHDPWLALRNQGGGNGSVRNVRITGQPIVPDEVSLSELRTSSWANADSSIAAANESHPITHLHGWMSWDEDPWSPEKMTWHLEEDRESDSRATTLIVGRHKSELADSGAERLLRYHWPIVWDSSEITYDFFYRDGESLVHPAIGRRALLLGQDSVTNHWVTNALWDTTTLDPLNASASGNRFSSRRLPFRPNAWNQMKLSIKGNELRLSLNGVQIFAGDIEPTNDRTFGLFYYCDQTEARVRNVVLKGDWPKSVPPVTEQELRGTKTDVLDRERKAMPESFEFDFAEATDEEVKATFTEYVEGSTANVRVPGGWQMSGVADGPRGHSDSMTQPRIEIAGDFDVIAEFTDLKLTASENGTAAIYVGPRLTQGRFEMHMLYRGMVQHPDTPLREITQVEVIKASPRGRSFEYPFIGTDECRSGRLRVARRGTTFHYLIAPLDSDSFLLLHSMEVSNIPIPSGSFTLRTSCYSLGVESSEVSVVWKKMSIRAESIEQTQNW